ncbi:MAG: RNA methyltransferase [Thermomicrobiales bacterium]|nr:RNA methyltransferase [Thermomicrobiales bacterium]
MDPGATVSSAVDRRTLSSAGSEKVSKWPRTTRRQERVRAVLERRQPDLTLILENVHDPHNVSAILRSCDAVGVLKVHAVYSIEAPPPSMFARQTSASAAKWVEVVRHDSVAACVTALRATGTQILATALGQASRPLHAWDLTRSVALIVGNEMRGVSDEALSLADGLVEIPMVGMVQSLNVSVASAVCLYEAFRQRLAAGSYAAPRLSEAELASLEQDWLRR